MTTIITIVVVALVFFVTVCIVGFMVWKREAEMRTDSIKAIEYNVEEMLHELMGNSSMDYRRRVRQDEVGRSYDEPQHETNDRAGKEAYREEDPGDSAQEKPREPIQQEREENDDERVKVFEPSPVQYTSFDRGRGLTERDGRHGLRWKEIQQPQDDEEGDGTPEAHETSEPTETPEPIKTPEASEKPEPSDPVGELELPDVPESVPDVEMTEPSHDLQPEYEPQPEIEAMQLPEQEPPPADTSTPEADLIMLQEAYDEPEPEPLVTEEEDEPEETGGPLSKFLKRHKKNKADREAAPPRDAAPEQEMYESIDDLLRDYISEPYDSSEANREAWDEPDQETYYQEPIKPGYDVGKSGRKYTAAELEALIKE